MAGKKKRRVTLALMLAYLPISFLYLGFSGQLGAADWRTASRESTGLAPDPATTPEAVVQVYSARAVGWRGWFGVHTWIAVKPANASEFTVHEVNGWRLRRTGTVVMSTHRPADGHWYGNPPELLGRRPRTRRRGHHRAHRSGREGVPLPRIAITSGRVRTPIPLPRSCCAMRRNYASICRPRPSARTISAGGR